ncbi:hypothetical protein DKX38_016671 [Salix brachista]|uniref:Uncharacterized protein n=1 Tax=Salix brachista TaxID=2182728 RepID=A0A5N5L987_9ROSI|nr:hypothetical protein DKX38_016671 [Salix brachista]
MAVFNQRPTRMKNIQPEANKNEEHLKGKAWLQSEPKIVMHVNKLQARFQAGVFIVEVSKATTRQPCPVEETTTTDEDPIPPNLSVGEGGGQEKSMTSQLSQIHERVWKNIKPKDTSTAEKEEVMNEE